MAPYIRRKQYMPEDMNKSNAILDFTKSLFLEPEYADVTFIIGDRRFPVHKIILITRLDYFRVMLCGSFAEANKSEIELHVDPDAFLLILQYIYIGVFNLDLLNEKDMINALELAREYYFNEFIFSFCNCLNQRFSVTFFAPTMNIARHFPCIFGYEEKLHELCINGTYVIKQKCFLLLDKDVLVDILSSDYLNANEFEIFKETLEWRKTHTQEEFEELIPHIRFSLFSIIQLRTHVQSTGILTDTKVEELINEIKTSQKLPYRHHQFQIHYQHNAVEKPVGPIMLDLDKFYGSFWYRFTYRNAKPINAFKMKSFLDID